MMNEDWLPNPTYRLPAERRRGPDGEPDVAWTHEFQSGVTGVTVGVETVYATIGGSVIAVGTDGTGQWRVDVSAQGGPVVVDGTIYVVSPQIMSPSDSSILALDASDGSQRWRNHKIHPIVVNITARLAVVDDVLYVADRNCVYAVDVADGSVDFAFRGTADEVFQLGPAVADGILYVGGNKPEDGVMYALDAADGSERWRTELDQPIRPPAVADGTVYVSSRGGIHALDAADGNERWSFDQNISTAPAVVNGTVYVGGNGTLYALSASIGSQRWQVDCDFGSYGPPVVDDGTIYVGGGDGLYALDAADGSEQWRFRTEEVMYPPVVVDGRIYIGGDDGTLYALGSRTTPTEVYTAEEDAESRSGNEDDDATAVYRPCSNCGADLGEYGDVDFCPECGSEL
jgi:outer membrane protein assembly factor BamB